MEGPLLRLLLLVAGLLAAVLPAAAAATTFGPQPGAPCEPTLLATQVSLFCAPNMLSAQCCEPVVAAVDLGGGVPCLCRVAAEPRVAMAGFNPKYLLALYISCGGRRNVSAHLAAACEGPASPAADVFAPPPSSAAHRKQPLADCAAAMPTPPRFKTLEHASEGHAFYGRRDLEGSCDQFSLVNPNAAVRNVEMGQQQQAGAGMENLGNNVQNLGRSNNVPPPLPQRGLEAPLVAKPSTAPISDPAERFKPSAPPLPQEA
ncbi:hypothetical protein ACQ4PT_022261 [Festuca glaucescens]